MIYLSPFLNFPSFCLYISAEFLVSRIQLGEVLFIILSDNLCLLIGVLRSFILNIITDMAEFKSTILPFVFCYTFHHFFPFVVFFCLLLDYGAFFINLFYFFCWFINYNTLLSFLWLLQDLRYISLAYKVYLQGIFFHFIYSIRIL